MSQTSLLGLALLWALAMMCVGFIAADLLNSY
jgi:hypothetical protein